MKILITGASGLLGKALLEVLPYDLIPCAAVGAKNDGRDWNIFDITNFSHTVDIIKKHAPDIIIHCAAIGSVDKVQQDVRSGLGVNLHGTRHVIAGARSIGAKLIGISTNAVFDGRSPLYNEDSWLCPTSNYGIIKAASEFEIRSCDLDWMIMRPILMYGQNNVGSRANWVTIWLDKLKNNQECLVANDTVTQPLYNYDCAQVIKKAIEKEAWGNIFNVGGSDRCSLYDFATHVADIFGYNRNLIKAVPSSHFYNIAPRPKDTSYDLVKIRKLLDHKPMSIYDGLSDMKRITRYEKEDLKC